MNIVKKKLAEILPYWRNPRNNDAAVDSVVESIKSFGYVTPIVVDSSMVIIAGHTRYKALQRLGIDEVEVLVSPMSQDQARGYRIIDNKTSEKATWNMEHLIPEMRAYLDMPKFEVHFPELKIDVGSSHYAPTTSADVEKAQSGHDSKFQDTVSAREQQIQTYTCPHCSQEFDVPV